MHTSSAIQKHNNFPRDISKAKDSSHPCQKAHCYLVSIRALTLLAKALAFVKLKIYWMSAQRTPLRTNLSGEPLGPACFLLHSLWPTFTRYTVNASESQQTNKGEISLLPSGAVQDENMTSSLRIC